METYNYFYNGMPITKEQFIKAVPDNWEEEVENGDYSYGYFRASEKEEEE